MSKYELVFAGFIMVDFMLALTSMLIGIVVFFIS